jgi:protein-tyrosine phosphatase
MMRRYPFEAVYNCRDLGGYTCQDGSLTKERVFIRSDNLTHLKEEEMIYLKSIGLKAVIDFRHQNEVDPEPDPFSNDLEVKYHSVSILDHAQFTLEDLNRIQLHELYIQIAKNKAFIRAVFEQLAQTQGTTLFHCSAGKDRTGVISALVLKLVGVNDIDIVADYEVSYTYLVPKYSTGDVNVSLVYQDLFDSKRTTMELFLTYLNTQFDSIDDYFRGIGIRDDLLENIKTKFKKPGGFKP